MSYTARSSPPKSNARIAWLVAMWSEQHRRLSLLLGRITDFSGLQRLSPQGQTKFMHLMEQVGDAEAHEQQILNNIESIEAEHRFRRQQKMLRQAHEVPAAKDRHPTMDEEAAPQPTQNMGWMFAVWYLLFKRGINQKSPTPTDG